MGDSPPSADEGAYRMEELRRRRIRAALADVAVLFVAFIVYGVAADRIETGPDEYSVALEGIPFVLFLTFEFSYFFVLEWATGQTLGKRWLGIRITNVSGAPAGPGRVAIRTLLRFVDWLPFLYLVGYVAIRVSGERAQRLGDMAARTSIRLAEETPRRPAIPRLRAAAALGLIAALTLAGTALWSDGGDGVSTRANRVIVGEDFTTSVPSEWRDQTARLAPQFEANDVIKLEIDHVAVRDDREGSQPALIIGHEDRLLQGSLESRVRDFNQISRRSIPDFEIVRAPAPATVDGRRGLMFEYTAMPSGPVRVRHISVAFRKRHYFFTLTAPPGSFDSAVPVFDEVIRSWHWTASSAAADH